MNWERSGDYTDILYDTSAPGGIAKITINRPEVRNAFRPRTVISKPSAQTASRRARVI